MNRFMSKIKKSFTYELPIIRLYALLYLIGVFIGVQLFKGGNGCISVGVSYENFGKGIIGCFPCVYLVRFYLKGYACVLVDKLSEISGGGYMLLTGIHVSDDNVFRKIAFGFRCFRYDRCVGGVART